ncbi:MAG: radical SAM protein [Deltaproteobacteria bacterium]|nr:radical SAM protein [Deltaproteobacteria bacterium]
MTNLGFQTVYHLFNSLEGTVCERAFLPSKEDIDEHARTNTPLFSYESQTPLKDFDIVAFSVPFEEDYINIPRILRLSGIPLVSSDRPMTPLLIGGGVALSLNPEPVADFFDLFLLGEGEGSLPPVMELFGKARSEGLDKKEALKTFDSIEWAYVPSLYEFVYDGIGIKEIKRVKSAKKKVVAAKNFDLSAYEIPENFIETPESEFKDTYLMELERGCGRGCRFCAAGFLYLPPRWREIDKVKEAVKKGVASRGKVGLIGTAVSEYPEIKEVLSYGTGLKGVMTLSSLRLDRLDGELLGLLKEGGYKTITLAPEAGSERMRKVVNKGMTDEEIMESIRLIHEAGFRKVKLYFIVGFPSETDADAEGIVELTKRIKGVLKKGEIALSVNPFIPKPFTPFQWCTFTDARVVEKRLSIIKDGLKNERGVVVKEMSAKEAFLQAYIARADRRAGAVLAEAAENGWKKAQKPASELINASVYAERTRSDILPWDMIDHGVKKDYLWKEYLKGLSGGLTPPCNVGACFRCGVCRPEFFS